MLSVGQLNSNMSPLLLKLTKKPFKQLIYRQDSSEMTLVRILSTSCITTGRDFTRCGMTVCPLQKSHARKKY